jgi:hypothetical protein
VLVALCRPFKETSGYVTPATNQQIAAELFLSVDAVKTHLRALFAKFWVEQLPQNQKRVRLVELALTGAVTQLRNRGHRRAGAVRIAGWCCYRSARR